MTKKEFMHELENSNTNYESKLLIWHEGELSTTDLSCIEFFSESIKIINGEAEQLIFFSNISEIKVETN